MKRLMNKHNTNVYGKHGGLQRLLVHPEWLSEWVSPFFNHYTEKHLKKLHLHSSFSNKSLFLPLWWLIAVKKIKQDINLNSTQKLWRTYSCQVLSSHAYQGQLRAQSNAQNWNWVVGLRRGNVSTRMYTRVKFFTGNQGWAHTRIKV